MDEISKIAWVNPETKKVVKKKKLINKINSIKSVGKFISERNVVDQVTLTIAAIIEGVDVTLMDPSLEERDLISQNADHKHSVNISIQNWSDLKIRLRNATKNNGRIGMFSSGSTGKPKHVWQSLDNLCNNVKIRPSFSNHRWGLCYEPTHMAGILVLLQALLNGNMISYLFESDPDVIGDAIRKNGITHLSATPTFYRLRIIPLEGEYPTVQRITSGGEPFDTETMEKLREIFPNAAVRNIYALTETGALMESASECFDITDDLSGLVKVAENGELFIESSIVQDADDEHISEDGWFKTGDVVKKNDDGSIKFIGRIDNRVNVAGYQVHIHNIEQEIISVDERVVDVVVKDRDNSVTGNILVATISIIPNADAKSVVKDVRRKLSSKLPDFKVPKKYNVEKVEKLTRTGKKKR